MNKSMLYYIFTKKKIVGRQRKQNSRNMLVQLLQNLRLFFLPKNGPSQTHFKIKTKNEKKVYQVH